MVRVRFNDAERALLAKSRAGGTVLDWRNGPAWGQRIRITGPMAGDANGRTYWPAQVLTTRGLCRAGDYVRVYPGTVRALPVSAGAPSGQAIDRAATDRADHDQATPANGDAEGLFCEVPGPGDPQPEQALQLDLGLGTSTSAPDPLDPATARASRDYEALQILTRLHYDGHHLIAMGDRQGQRAVTWLATAGLVASRADEHGNAVLAATEAGERAIRAHVDRIEATLKRPVDVAPGDLIQPPGRPGSVVQVQRVRRDDGVVRMSGVFIDAPSAGLPAQVDWHLNGREDGWPTVPLSQDPRNGERIAHLNSVPGQYLLALARLQAVDTRLGATRPYFQQAVDLIHDAMDHGAPPQEALLRVAAQLRAVADRPTGTATQRRDLPPERADGIRRLAAELDQVIAEVTTLDEDRPPAADEPRVQTEPSTVIGTGGPVVAADTAEEMPTTGDDLMTASRSPAEPGPATTGAPVTAVPAPAGRGEDGPTSPAAAALDPVEASAGRYAGWFADPAKITAAVTSWNGITSPDRRRRLRDHGVAAPAGYAWDDDHALHPAPATVAAAASAGGREAVGTGRDDLALDTAVPAVGRDEPIGVTDGRDEQGIRGPGTRALEDLPAAGLQPDPGGRAGGLLPGVGVSGTRADHRTGGQPGGPGRAGGERPGQAGSAEQRPGDGRGAGDPGDAAAGAGDSRIVPGGGPGLAGENGEGPAARFVPRGQHDLAPAGDHHKARANIAALRVLRALESTGRPATTQEQSILARWSGWGSLAEQLFGGNPDHAAAFAQERAALAELLSGEDREAALDSTLNAHYTDARIVSAIWTALGDLGLTSGQVLEPGCGSGNFIGLAPDGVQMVGVELDPTTAAIAAAVYPDAVVVNQDLAQFAVPATTFDAVVGNVPFGTRRPFDPVHNPGRQLSLHNYVIAKALGQTRPGGLVAVITSRYTLDSIDDKARRILHDRARFLGAVRLPSGAHRDAAGTEVVTDVLLLRRRLPGEIPDRAETWLSARPLAAGEHDGGHDSGDGPDSGEQAAAGPGALAVNDYFTDHPEQVLGQMSVGRGARGRPELVVTGGLDDSAARLRQALGRLVAAARENGLGQTARTDEATPVREVLAARSDLPEGQLVRQGDGFALVESGRLVEVPVPKARVAEMTALLALRDAAVAMLAADQASEQDTDACWAARARVNQLYDAYRSRFGPINRGRWVTTTPKNVVLDRPEAVAVGDLQAGDIIRWPGTDKTGRARRAVVDSVGDDGAVTVNVVGVQGRARRQRFTDTGATKLGTRHQQRRFVREVPPVFDLDDRASLVLALESYDRETGQAEKTTLLTERIVRKPPQPGTVSDPDDALTIVLDDTGGVDLAAVAALMGTDEATARGRLGNRVFVDHETGELVSAVGYLSGDVRAKLAAAEAAAQTDPTLQVNVEALREVLPAWKHADEIKAYPGASWIPIEDLEAFLVDILQDEAVQVSHEQGEGWKVAAGRRRSGTDPLTTSEWGTPDHDAYDVFEAMLRRAKLTVRTEEGRIDGERTAAAYAAAERIRVRFEEWVWEQPGRGARLETIYNQQLNSLVPSRYPTRALCPPGMTDQITLAAHQAAAVRRITAEPASLVTHKVGAGKTYTLVAGLMELKRLGHIRKPMLVVPNHLKEQWQRDWLTLYPDARVLAASTEDLNRVGRDRFLGRAATGDWDAVIVTQEVFRSIPVSRSTAHEYVKTELAVFEREIDQIEDDGVDQRTVKEERQRLARRRDKVEESLAAADASAWTFEVLGVDHIAVDEIHDYKNLARVSGSQEHSLEGSIRSMDLHVKAGWLWRTSESGRVLTGATATPLLNSFGEIHTWMRYFRPGSPMAQMSFDTFLANYALSSVKYEMTASGTREAKDRVRDYRNFSGVMRGWLNFADVAQLDLDVPDVDAGAPENVIVPASDWLTSEYLPHLAERAEEIRGKPRAKGQDTMPVILSDGLAAALDPRAVAGPDVGEDSKIVWVARAAAEIYHQTKANRYDDPLTGAEHPTPGAFQFMFLDLGTPGASKRYAATMAKIERLTLEAMHRLPDGPPVDVPVRVSEQVGFEAYEELKAQLVARGVPEKKVVFMHDAGGKDAKKAAIYKAAREGEIAVLIGSTQMMGTGVNAQTRAVALHNVDCPYRAADLEQRNGRIIRQRNQNSVVRILNYATEGSHDEVKWQAVQRKAQLLGRVAAGDLSINEISELGDDLGIEEMTAQLSGSPAKIDKSRVDQELMTVAAARKAFQRAQGNAQYARASNRAQAAAVHQRLQRLDESIPRLTRRPGAPVGGYTAVVGGRQVAVRADATAEVRSAIAAQIAAHRGLRPGPTFTVGTFGGFEVVARVVPLIQGPQVEMRLPDLPDIDPNPVEAAKNDSIDYLARITNALDRLEPLRLELQALLPGLERNIANADNLLGRTFADEDRYQALLRRWDRLTALVAWEDDPARSGDETPPAALTTDPPDVVAVLGALRSQATTEERPAPVSLANITDDGQRIPRQTSQMRRQPEQQAEAGPAPDVMPTAPEAAIAAASPDAQPQRVSPTLTQVLVDLSHPQPGSHQQRVLYSVQATRDSAWAVFAPGHPEPLAIRPSREQAETWALQLARTGTPPDTPAHRADTTTAHHGDDEPATPPAPPALASARREPAAGPDQDDINAPEPGSAPQPEAAEPQADDPAGPPARPDSAAGPDDRPALDAAPPDRPAPGPRAGAPEPGQRLPTGRVTITGTITSIRDEPNHHAYNATTWKTLITAPAGWRVWMTLPGHLIQTAMVEQDQARQANPSGPFVPWTHYLEGRTITVTVTVKPSGKDPQFGYGKSPAKAVLGPPITETAPPGSAPQPSPAPTQDPAVPDRTREPQDSIEDLPPEPPRPHVPAGQDGTQARTEEGTDEATGPAQPAPEHLDTSSTAAAPAASSPQGPARVPADTADWTHGFTAREQAIIRNAVDDRAGMYFNSPIGGRQTAIRYTVEGPLRDLCDRHGYRRMCGAVNAYLDANPHALDHSYAHAEQAARDADRARQDDDLQAQALDAYQAGDYGLALSLIDQAEQINPVGDHHDRIRDRIRVTAAQAAATDPPPAQADRASLDPALPPQEAGEDLPPVSPGPAAADTDPARQDGNQTGADSTDDVTGAIEAAPGRPGPELGVPAAAPALSTVVQSLINHAFHSGFTPLVGDPDPDSDGEFAVSLLDSSGGSALVLVVSGDQNQVTLHGLPDREINGWTSEVIPPTNPAAIRDAITDHAARLWPSITPEPSGRAEAGAASAGHHEPSPGVDAQSVPARTDRNAAGGPDNAPRPLQPSPAAGATAAAPEPSTTDTTDEVEVPDSPQPAEEEQLLLLSPWQIASNARTEPHDRGEASPSERPDPVDPGAGTGPHARGPAHLDHVAEEVEREQPERQVSDDDLATQPPSRLAADPAPSSPGSGPGPLAEALQTVRDMVPRADQVLLTTSGPDDAGFVLRDVVLVDGASLTATDPDLLVEVCETCGHALSRLARNADVGEDSQGNATLQLNAQIRGPEPTPADAETAAGLHTAAAPDLTAVRSPTPDPAVADPIAAPATTSPQPLLPIDPADSTAPPAQTPGRPHLDEEITMPAPSQDALAQVLDDEPATATSRAGGRSEPELARPRQAPPAPTATPADDRTPVTKDEETELLRHPDADDPASANDAMLEDLDFLDTPDDIGPDQPQTSPAPDRAAHDLSRQPVEGRAVRATDPDAANLEPPAPAAVAGEARARIGRSYAAVDAELRQLQSEIVAAKEALDQALDARPRPRSGADLSVGEAALQLLDASIAAVGRRLAPVTQTQEWQQITQVWKTTRQAWAQVRQLVERDGFRRAAEQLLRTLATRAAEAIAGLAERAVSRLGASTPLAGAARQALTQLSTTARDVADKVRPLTPAAADLRATNTRVQAEFRHTQAAVDAAFAEILGAFPSTTRQPQPGQAPAVPAPADDQRRPVGQQPVGQQRPAGERKSAETGTEPTAAMRWWAGVVRKIDPSLLDEPGYRRLAAAMERAQSAAEGGADVATLLPQLAARGSWTPGQGADALRVRLTKECPASATPRPAAVMVGAGAGGAGPRQPERPPVPAPPRPAPRRGR